MPLVSIITATYNSESYIMDLYNSLLEQTHQKWEWIITDDFSSDNTSNIVNEICLNDPRVCFFKHDRNLGAAYARNNSLSKSSGEFIAFIDSDDLWNSQKLEKQIDFMNNENINFSFTSYELINQHGDRLHKIVDNTHEEIKFSYHDLLKKKITLGCSTVVLKKKLIEKNRMPLLRTGQDYAFWLAILKKGEHAFLLKQVLTSYRITPGSISRNKIKKALRQWEIYRVVEKLPLASSLWYFSCYAWRAINRR